VGFGFLVVWILGIRSTSNLKTIPSANTTDFLPWLMAVTLMAFAVGIAGPAGFVSGGHNPAASGSTLFGFVLVSIFLSRKLAIRSMPTFGSINLSTGTMLPILGKFAFVQHGIRFMARCTAASSLGSTVSAIPIALFGVALAMLVVWL